MSVSQFDGWESSPEAAAFRAEQARQHADAVQEEQEAEEAMAAERAAQADREWDELTESEEYAAWCDGEDAA